MNQTKTIKKLFHIYQDDKNEWRIADNLTLETNVTKPLMIYISLTGNTNPQFTKLASDYLIDKDFIYRYDWLIGFSCFEGEANWWNWLNSLNSNDALRVQLIIRNDETGIGFNEINASLLTLYPSKHSTSFLEKSLSIASDLSDVLQFEKVKKISELANKLISSQKGTKWYITKYFDSKYKSFGVEWHINRVVLEEFGPMIRGSLTMSFTCEELKSVNNLKLILKPIIKFNNVKDDIAGLEINKPIISLPITINQKPK
jgi:hypothetical protein